MTKLKTEEKQDIQEQPNGGILTEGKISLFFLGLLSISFVGYFALRDLWIGFIFGHTAALSIMGFYGCLAGVIARKKGYSYRRAFLIGFFVPIIVGAIPTFLMVPPGERSLSLACGGWFSLAAGIIVVISYLFLKKRDTSKQITAE